MELLYHFSIIIRKFTAGKVFPSKRSLSHIQMYSELSLPYI
jgi:hypothetical protein